MILGTGQGFDFLMSLIQASRPMVSESPEGKVYEIKLFVYVVFLFISYFLYIDNDQNE